MPVFTIAGVLSPVTAIPVVAATMTLAVPPTLKAILPPELTALASVVPLTILVTETAELSPVN